MATKEPKQTIRSFCPQVPAELVDAFVARMDADYFATFPPEEIATHLLMAETLSDDQLIQMANRSPAFAADVYLDAPYQSPFFAIVHATRLVAPQLAEVFRVEKRKVPTPSPDEALTRPLNVKSTDPGI